MHMVKRFYIAWGRHSLGSFLKLVLKNIIYYQKHLFSGKLFKRTNEPSEFDLVHNSDTEKIREIGSLDIDSENACHAVRYQPSPYALATQLIYSLPIDYSQFTFIDFGAGKGRVILIAAQRPFDAVIGIEFSKELCQIANKNIGMIPPEQRVALKAECLFNDATQFQPPLAPLVCYFYNPFGEPIMRKVIDALESSLKKVPRELYVIYVHPEHRALFDSKTYFDVKEEDDFYIVYRVNKDKLVESCL